ncbi:[acyl-carrier-protein] S-malonyltransferase [Frankineae bacterium MT45]|nr:[acyl-carrier-protein] S-malonyltransferase [Frankineae bacterium MT45]
MIAILAPGQGAQTPGMLSPWLELPGVAEQVELFSDTAQLDLRRLGTTADADEIKDTAVTQPLIVALSLIAAGQLGLESTHSTILAAGHSVGEVAAAAIAGVLSSADAVALAAHRGAAMAAACALAPSGMTALLGGDPDEVVGLIEAVGLTAANRNGAGQIVAAGAQGGLTALAENVPTGVRVRPLPVAGAFHTDFMISAQRPLAEFTHDLLLSDPRHLLLSNFDGTALTTGSQVISNLVGQLTRSVRWDLCQATITHVGVNAAIELAPAGALAGLAKREMPEVKVVALKTPDDLGAARALLDDYGAVSQGEHTPDFQVVVTPAKGIFTRHDDLHEGQQVARGARIGTITTNRDAHPVIAPSAGELAEWLKHDGDIVAAGLPVARLQSEA